jgi:uncharacterized protein YlxW (UPF0749 family)
MNKERIFPSIDADLVVWMRNQYTKGEMSKTINDYFRYLMEQERGNPQKEEKDDLIKKVTNLQEQISELMKEMAMYKAEIRKIEQIEQIEDDEIVKKLEGELEAMKQSGAWADMAGR